MHRLGAAHGLGGGDRSAPAAVEGAPAVSRVGSRAEHRLQRAVRRDVPAGHRAAAAGRGVSRCAGGAADSRPDDGRRLLPALRRGGDRGVAGGDQRDARRASGARSRRRSSPRRSSTRTARWSRPRASASRGWTSPTTACGAITRWWCRWPTRRSRCGWSTAAAIGRRRRARPSGSTRRATLCRDGGVPADHVSRRHRLLADAAPGSLGRRGRAVRLRLRRAARV